MKTLLPLIVGASLAFGGYAMAQTPDAKGNAPIKQTHTVDDGAAKPGANSFTQGQAKQHILNSGYASVSDLDQGFGRHLARRRHEGRARTVNVSLDFQGQCLGAGSGRSLTRGRSPAILAFLQRPFAPPGTPGVIRAEPGSAKVIGGDELRQLGCSLIRLNRPDPDA